MDYILAIDIGTTSTKVVAFDKAGKLLKKENAFYETFSPQPAFQEQSPDDVYAALMQAVTQMTKNFAEPPLCIVFSSAMHSIIAVDEQCHPLTNSIIWADGRSQSYANQLIATDLGKAIFYHTGTPIHAMSPLCKIAWLKEQDKTTFEKVYKFISIKEYIHYQWFKKFKIDHSIASATGLFDIREKTWYAPALDYCGIRISQLSEPVPTDYIFEHIDTGIANELGIPDRTPVVIGASDGCLANLGEGVLDDQSLVISIGTSAAVRMTHSAPIEGSVNASFNYILDDQFYVVGGASNNGGIIHEWFKANLGWDEKINHQASNISVGADKLLFLPYLLGERAPVWNANAKGGFIGLSQAHTLSHLYRATLEGIIFNLFAISENIIKQPIRIYVNGGFTKNELAMQILADVFQAAVHLEDHEEGAALGATKLGLKAIGIIEDYQELSIQSSAKIIQPNPSVHATYQSYYTIWKDLYGHLKERLLMLYEL